jgi:hypothetical protein
MPDTAIATDDRTELRRLHRAPEPEVVAPLLRAATLSA